MEPTTGNVPSSQRIVRDVEKVFESMIMIAKGTDVQGRGNRKGAGRRRNQVGNRGGAHPRKRGLKKYRSNERWIHHDARSELKFKIESAVRKHKLK